MEKKLLNEETYKKNKKIITGIALIVLIIGILIGGSLIATGIIKSSNIEPSSSSLRTKEVIQAEIDELNNELIPLKAEENQEFKENRFSEEYYRLKNEISIREKKISELNTEIWKSETGFNSTKDSIAKSKYIPFYIFGAFIIIVSCMISFSIYMFAKRREIAAFTAQQIMPVAQEGMNAIAPSIGNVAKEISKGINESKVEVTDKEKSEKPNG